MYIPIKKMILQTIIFIKKGITSKMLFYLLCACNQNVYIPLQKLTVHLTVFITISHVVVVPFSFDGSFQILCGFTKLKKVTLASMKERELFSNRFLWLLHITVNVNDD